MPVTKDEAHMLATIAVACRPIGARRWHAAGVAAIVLNHVAHMSLAEVTKAAVRLAEDINADTPGALKDPRNPCWAERIAQVGPATAPRAVDECPRHPGSDAVTCRGCGADKLAKTESPPKRNIKAANQSGHADLAREAMRAGKHTDTEEAS